ncbi:dihydrofolate reductase [Leptospira sp. 96542]|nr:dihydrofolate reductase [Leptospira sp. 96542]
MIQYLSFIATSLDGNIADISGGIDWLIDPKINIQNEDYGYEEFFESIDCMVMGKNSFLKILEFPNYPYGNKKIWVLSKNDIQIPSNLKEFVFHFAGSILELDQKLIKEGNTKRVYVDGGKVITSYILLKLLKEITITTIPVLIGEGIPLWTLNPGNLISLKVLSNKLYENGFLKTTYAIL